MYSGEAERQAAIPPALGEEETKEEIKQEEEVELEQEQEQAVEQQMPPMTEETVQHQ